MESTNSTFATATPRRTVTGARWLHCFTPAGRPSALRRVSRAALGAATTLLLVIGIASFAFLAVGPHVLGYRTASMLSGSMVPTIRPGDVVIDTPEPISAIRLGQILTIQTPTPTRYVDSHRVVQVIRRDGETLIRTKGDANKVNDPWLARVHGTVAWRVRSVVPDLGYAVSALRSPWLHAILLWGAPSLLVAWGLIAIWRRPGDEPASISE